MAGWMSDCGCSSIKSVVTYPEKKRIFLWIYKWGVGVRPSFLKSTCSKHSKTGKFEIQNN